MTAITMTAPISVGDVPHLAQAVTRHDTLPEAAIAAIRAHDGSILVDLDETLYLRNSTEDFIDSAQPGLVGLLLMRFLDAVKPWRWTGGEATRDVWRVHLIALVLPWTAWLWPWRAARHAAAFANRQLVSVLAAHRMPPIIMTIGFEPIVKPLVAAIGLPEARIVAARRFNFSDRRRGKLSMAIDALGIDSVRRSLVVTDSIQDLPLLDACAHPLRTLWPGAKYRKALSGVYLPGEYLSQVKRPGERYILRGILQEDFACWTLCSIALAPMPILHVVGLLFLLASFWTIYERGYVGNDLIAARFENDPKLSTAFRAAPVATPRLQPWFWALASGGIGIFLLRGMVIPAPVDCAKWLAVLFGTHAWFNAYNRFDKTTRIWLYGGLQFARTAAFAVLAPIAGPVAAAAVGANVISRWVPYYVYRSTGREWPRTQNMLPRLVFFVTFSLVLALAQGASILWNWTALCLLLWDMFRARHELKAGFTAATRLDRPSS